MFAALVLGGSERSEIERALAGITRPVFCDDVRELLRTCESSSLVGVIAELRDACGALSGAAVARVGSKIHGLHPLAYIASAAADVHDLGPWPPCTVLVRGRDAVGAAVRAAALKARECGAGAELVRALENGTPASIVPFVEIVAFRPWPPLKAHVAARLAGIPYRTLVRHLRHARLPTSGQIIKWSRLLHAAWQLFELNHSRQQVAHDLGFPSVKALTDLLRKEALCSWDEVRIAGGFPHLLECFVRGLEQHRCLAQVFGPPSAQPSLRSASDLAVYAHPAAAMPARASQADRRTRRCLV